MNVQLKGLEKFSKTINEINKYNAIVGFLGDEKSLRTEGEITNPELAAIHHFGSITKNIPSRSPFIGFEMKENTQKIANIIADELKKNLKNPNVEQAFQKAGIAGENLIDDAFQTSGFGKWVPIKEKTAKRKGNDKTLIDTDQLHKSRVSKVIKK